MNSKISDKDKKDWEEFLLRKENLPDKEINLNLKKNRKEYIFDLHGYSLEEANRKVKSLIHDAFDKGISKLIIVTGKGLHSQNEKDPYVSKNFGILKNSVPEFINSNEELMSMINDIKDASIEDGGSGAFYILMKKKL